MIEDGVAKGSSADAEILPLLARIRSGEPDSFEELVARYRPLIVAQASAFSDADEFSRAEAQVDAVVALHEAAMSYSPERGTTFGLFAKICIGRALAKAKIRNAPLPDDLPDPDAFATGEAIERKMLDDESVREFHRRVKSIASDYEYRVFCLHLGGASVDVTAARLGKPVRSIENARERLFSKIRSHPDLFGDLY